MYIHRRERVYIITVIWLSTDVHVYVYLEHYTYTRSYICVYIYIEPYIYRERDTHTYVYILAQVPPPPLKKVESWERPVAV